MWIPLPEGLRNFVFSQLLEEMNVAWLRNSGKQEGFHFLFPDLEVQIVLLVSPTFFRPGK